MARIKVHELRHNTKPDLLAQLKDLKSELALLRGRRIRWSAEGLNRRRWRSFDIVNNDLGLLFAMRVLGIAGDGLVVGLAGRKASRRS
ncbi:hypothetical protein ACFX2I_020977 [Malus domestica]|uniref:Uncharacterized protein n=1 Tax=Malus domestica TaxID=3750 RepID=A0A498HEG8_MALDO|nr:hypothetical protein DVH24_007122 [Malus domestica]